MVAMNSGQLTLELPIIELAEVEARIMRTGRSLADKRV
jgi:hypothetical protein